MADRKSPAQRLPDALREAVERTVSATRESVEATRESAKQQAKGTRGRAQEAVDEIVKGAEAGAETLRDRVRGARPVTSDDLKDLRRELRAIGRRLDAIEERLPAKRSGGKAASARSAGGSRSGGSTGSRSGGASGSRSGSGSRSSRS
jgi:hypothetical protein